MKVSTTWLQVSKDTKFVNFGVNINGEVDFFRIAIIDDMGVVGMVVFDPDGKRIKTVTVEDEEVVDMDFDFDDKKYMLQLIPSNYAYEIMVELMNREKEICYG